MNPQTAIISIVLFIRKRKPRLIRWISRLPRWKVGAGVLVVALLIGGAYALWGRQTPQDAPTATVPNVEVKSVAELSSATSPLSVVGQVSSKSEATVRTEKAGQVIAVYKTLGDTIGAGSVAAEIENASEQAAVLQAQGAYDAAQAALGKAQGTTAANTSISSAQASTAADNAQKSVLVALQSTFAALDDAVHTKADVLFLNPRKQSPSFNLIITDNNLYIGIQKQRVQLESVLKKSEALISLSTADTDGAIAAMLANAQIVNTFVNDVIEAINLIEPNTNLSSATIDTYRSSLGAARIEVVAAIASLNAQKASYDAARAGAQTAVNAATGGTENDVAAAQAAVKQAQGGLAAARANLEKTIIRAPISGTINSFSLKRGDYVQASSPVLTVANNGALEVVAYITENDAREIAVGQKASIDTASGVVTRIAPALDPITKKIEVRIGVDNAKDLINGQSVLVSITRAQANTGDLSRITIPISAIKVESEQVVVFTVDSNNSLIAHPVVLGALLGDRVVVSSGLSDEMKIVTDARGLREGEKVEVK